MAAVFRSDVAVQHFLSTISTSTPDPSHLLGLWKVWRIFIISYNQGLWFIEACIVFCCFIFSICFCCFAGVKKSCTAEVSHNLYLTLFILETVSRKKTIVAKCCGLFTSGINLWKPATWLSFYLFSLHKGVNVVTAMFHRHPWIHQYPCNHLSNQRLRTLKSAAMPLQHPLRTQLVRLSGRTQYQTSILTC